jgi:small subunit ribosomal protein S3
MAQKASPYAIRLGYNQEWNNYFFAKNSREQVEWMKKDKTIRDYLYSLFPDICRLKIEYNESKISIYLYIPEIGLVLGENNSKLAEVMKGIYKIINDEKISVKVNLFKAENAQSIANLIAGQLKKRVRSFQIIRGITEKIFAKREAKGLAISINGLVDGFENAQKKKFVQGRMKFSEKDSNIEGGEAIALMPRGVIGIKVWLYKGKIWPKKNYANT